MIEAEKDRQYRGKNPLPIIWQNTDMRKLSIDAVDRIRLGLDALIPGTIYPIAYPSEKTGQYKIDLRIGYKGELFYIRKASLRKITDIRVELVYSTDEFTVFKKGVHCEVEGYDFKVTNPFDRGSFVGGFAYIEYEDEHENLLVVMSKKEIDKIKETSPSDKFWGKWYDEMAYKTIVHKAAKKVTIDPQKINVTALARIDDETVPAPDEPDELPPLELPDDEPEALPEAHEGAKATKEEPF